MTPRASTSPPRALRRRRVGRAGICCGHRRRLRQRCAPQSADRVGASVRAHASLLDSRCRRRRGGLRRGCRAEVRDGSRARPRLASHAAALPDAAPSSAWVAEQCSRSRAGGAGGAGAGLAGRAPVGARSGGGADPPLAWRRGTADFVLATTAATAKPVPARARAAEAAAAARVGASDRQANATDEGVADHQARSRYSRCRRAVPAGSSLWICDTHQSGRGRRRRSISTSPQRSGRYALPSPDGWQRYTCRHYMFDVFVRHGVCERARGA